ncbi:unnamed protein product [Ceratitis capitata]|uniref:(Mediterranean fruit fly) hypothetical protein n=1 Tax=Ceratitis capitata TaxID=7213 RepID=A0A811V7S1_CERCA|nr:unnamed protein product [Ceratitis capitata]
MVINSVVSQSIAYWSQDPCIGNPNISSNRINFAFLLVFEAEVVASRLRSGTSELPLEVTPFLESSLPPLAPNGKNSFPIGPDDFFGALALETLLQRSIRNKR